MNHNDIKIGSNRSFGIVFFIVFLLIAIYPLLSGESVRLWSLAIATIFFILGIIDSSLLSPLNKIWFKFGIFMGNFIAPIVMGIIYFFVVTPTGLIMKMLGKDLLNLKKSNKDSYWIKKDNSNSSLKNQF